MTRRKKDLLNVLDEMFTDEEAAATSLEEPAAPTEGVNPETSGPDGGSGEDAFAQDMFEQAGAGLEHEEERFSQWVAFRLGTERYGVDILQVEEILRMGQVTRVPHTPPAVSGVLNLRGTILVVLDARRILAMPARDIDESTRILVVHAKGGLVGLIVDAVDAVISLAESAIEPPAVLGSAGPEVKAVARHEGELMALLDPEKMVTAVAAS